MKNTQLFETQQPKLKLTQIHTLKMEFCFTNEEKHITFQNVLKIRGQKSKFAKSRNLTPHSNFGCNLSFLSLSARGMKCARSSVKMYDQQQLSSLGHVSQSLERHQKLHSLQTVFWSQQCCCFGSSLALFDIFFRTGRGSIGVHLLSVQPIWFWSSGFLSKFKIQQASVHVVPVLFVRGPLCFSNGQISLPWFFAIWNGERRRRRGPVWRESVFVVWALLSQKKKSVQEGASADKNEGGRKVGRRVSPSLKNKNVRL